MPYRQSLVRADITAGGHHLGVADKWSGGEGDSDIGTYMRADGEVTLGGVKTRGDGTATYLVDEAFWAVWGDLDRGRGSMRAIITLTPVADDGTPFATAEPAQFGATVKTVPTPQGDFSSNEGDAIDIVFKMDAERL